MQKDCSNCEENMTVTYESGENLYINLTNRCPNSCDFCVRTECEKHYGDLWLEREPTAEETIAEIKARDLSKYENLVFCGFGEPTERLQDLLTIAEAVKSYRPETVIRLNTNGQANLIAERDVTPLFEGKVDVISVSLNAPTAKAYDDICHSRFGEAAFDGLLDFAVKAKAYCREVIFSVVDESLSPADIAVCQKIADERGIYLRVREMIRD